MQESDHRRHNLKKCIPVACCLLCGSVCSVSCCPQASSSLLPLCQLATDWTTEAMSHSLLALRFVPIRCLGHGDTKLNNTTHSTLRPYSLHTHTHSVHTRAHCTHLRIIHILIYTKYTIHTCPAYTLHTHHITRAQVWHTLQADTTHTCIHFTNTLICILPTCHTDMHTPHTIHTHKVQQTYYTTINIHTHTNQAYTSALYTYHTHTNMMHIVTNFLSHIHRTPHIPHTHETSHSLCTYTTCACISHNTTCTAYMIHICNIHIAHKHTLGRSV